MLIGRIFCGLVHRVLGAAAGTTEYDATVEGDLLVTPRVRKSSQGYADLCIRRYVIDLLYVRLTRNSPRSETHTTEAYSLNVTLVTAAVDQCEAAPICMRDQVLIMSSSMKRPISVL